MESEKRNKTLINDQEQKENGHLDRLINNLIGYVDTQFKLIQLEVKEEIANAITILILVLLVAIIAAFAGLLFSIALATYMGDWLGSQVYGFCLVGGLYLAIAGIVLIQFKKIKAKISTLIHKKIKQIDIAKQEQLNP